MQTPTYLYTYPVQYKVGAHGRAPLLIIYSLYKDDHSPKASITRLVPYSMPPPIHR